MTITYNFHAIPHEFLTDEFLEDPIMMKFIRWIFKNISTTPRIGRMNGRNIPLEPFEFIFGRETSAEKAGISPMNARTRANQLKAMGHLQKVTSKSTSTFTVYRLATESFEQNGNQATNQHFNQHFNQHSNHNIEPRTKNLKEENKRKYIKEKVHPIEENEDLNQESSNPEKVAVGQDFSDQKQHNVHSQTKNQSSIEKSQKSLVRNSKKINTSKAKTRKKFEIPEEDRLRFGDYVWFSKSNNSYENLCKDLGKDLVHHFIECINLDLKSKDLSPTHYKDYAAAIRKWHKNAMSWGTLPKTSSQNSKQSNIDLAKEIYSRFNQEVQKKGFTMCLGPTYIEISPNGGNAKTINLRFDENGFRDQLESNLRKFGFSMAI